MGDEIITSSFSFSSWYRLTIRITLEWGKREFPDYDMMGIAVAHKWLDAWDRNTGNFMYMTGSYVGLEFLDVCELKEG